MCHSQCYNFLTKNGQSQSFVQQWILQACIDAGDQCLSVVKHKYTCIPLLLPRHKAQVISNWFPQLENELTAQIASSQIQHLWFVE